MIKEEIQQQINQEFLNHINEHYTDYYIDNQIEKGKIYLVQPDGSIDNSIEYDCEKHTLSWFDWCNEQTKQDVELLGLFIKEEKEKYIELGLVENKS